MIPEVIRTMEARIDGLDDQNRFNALLAVAKALAVTDLVVVSHQMRGIVGDIMTKMNHEDGKER